MSRIVSFFWIIGLVLLDQVSKFFFVSVLLDAPITVFSFFRFVLTVNTGIAFSIPVPSFFLLLLSFLFLGFLLFFVFRSSFRVPLEHYGLLLLLGGGIGNFIDRLFRDGVIDFFSFFQFPIFNFADVFITFGVLFLMVSWIRSEYRVKS